MNDTAMAAPAVTPGAGHNQPPPEFQLRNAEALRPYLDEAHADLIRRFDEIMESAKTLPTEIRSDDELAKASDWAKIAGTVMKAMEAARVLEKQPFDLAAAAVQAFFKTRMDKLKEGNGAKATGIIADLERAAADYMRKKEESERRRRQEAERKAQEEADRKRREAEAAARAEREAEERRLAAERARQEAERKRQEEEARRLAEEKAELVRQQKEAEERARREAEEIEAKRKAAEKAIKDAQDAEAKAKAEQEAAAAAAEALAKAEAEAKRRREEAAAQRAREAAAAEKARAEQERKAAEDARRKAAEDAEADRLRRQREQREKEQEIAAAEATKAAQAANAKSADLVRTRGDLGGKATLAESYVHSDIDRDTIDLETLRPHFTTEAIEAAVRAFIKAGGRQIRGTEIFLGRSGRLG